MIIKKESIFDRKSDARKKIMLGGLFVKAEFDYMHPHDASVLYGMLLDCKRALKQKPELILKWKEMGKELLLSDK
jgi:predicted secreted protein